MFKIIIILKFCADVDVAEILLRLQKTLLPNSATSDRFQYQHHGDGDLSHSHLQPCGTFSTEWAALQMQSYLLRR